MSEKKQPSKIKGLKTIFYILLASFFLFVFTYVKFLASPAKSSILYPLEMIMYDSRMRMLPKQRATNNILVAAIDEKSLKKFGRWPWNRDVVADFIDLTMKKGAKGIVFDVVFADKTKNDEENKKLLQVLAKYKNKIVMGSFFKTSYHYSWENKSQKLNDKEFTLISSKTRLFFKPLEKQAVSKFPLNYSMNSIVLPETKILENSSNVAFFSQRSDFDGIIRRYPLIQGISSKDKEKWFVLPSLALEATAVFTKKIPIIKYSTIGIDEISVGKYKIPTDSSGMVWINFFGDENQFKSISIADIEKADVKNKIVFVGSTALGAAYDVRSTPITGNMPGVFVHATMFSNILTHRFLLQNIFTFLIPLFFILFPFLFLKKMYLKFELWQTFLVTTFYLILFNFISYIFIKQGILVYSFTPSLYIVFMTIFISAGKYFFVDKERSQLKTAFSRYLDKRLLNKITEDISQLKLYGEEKEIVVLFSDIVGFTTLSESMEPAELVKAINRLFTPATNAVLENNGFLDKYMGDAMMALFGVPIDIEDKEKKSCDAALKIIERMDIIREEFKKEGKKDVKMGVGINAGKAVIGNMGSEHRFDFSAIGDTVNTSSRLEGLTRKYQVRIIASKTIVDKAKDEFVFRKLDVVKVKGKTLGVEIFELCGKKSSISQEILKRNEEYEKALEFFVQNKLQKVVEIYKTSNFKDDFAFKFLNERAKEMLKNNIEYNGIWEFKSK